jgi:hypothetical protein
LTIVDAKYDPTPFLEWPESLDSVLKVRRTHEKTMVVVEEILLLLGVHAPQAGLAEFEE